MLNARVSASSVVGVRRYPSSRLAPRGLGRRVASLLGTRASAKIIVLPAVSLKSTPGTVVITARASASYLRAHLCLFASQPTRPKLVAGGVGHASCGTTVSSEPYARCRKMSRLAALCYHVAVRGLCAHDSDVAPIKPLSFAHIFSGVADADHSVPEKQKRWLISQPALREGVGKFLGLTSGKDVGVMQIKWKKRMTALRSLLGACKDAHSALTKRAQAQLAARTRKEQARKRSEEQEHMQQLQDDVKKQAAEIANRREAGLRETMPLFSKMDPAMLPETTLIPRVAVESAIFNVDQPLLLTLPDTARFLTIKSAAKAAGAWSANYKKEDAFNESGKASALLKDVAKLHSNAFFSTFPDSCFDSPEMMDLSTVSKTFEGQVHFFGHAPGYNAASVTPNASPCAKLLAAGEVDRYTFSIFEFVSAWETIHKPEKMKSMDHLYTHVKNMSQETSEETTGAKPNFLRRCTQTSNQMLWIPTSYVHRERARGTVVAGIRNSFFPNSPARAASYQLAADLISRSGTDTKTMAEILGLMPGAGIEPALDQEHHARARPRAEELGEREAERTRMLRLYQEALDERQRNQAAIAEASGQAETAEHQAKALQMRLLGVTDGGESTRARLLRESAELVAARARLSDVARALEMQELTEEASGADRARLRHAVSTKTAEISEAR
ncbi:unnamed protein product [Prorocentrum cordatum]|uniref:Uncharacterized protein n=1 Tax=Prorocentrum cordatum TaxID=2364126 RepID=A0ABN9S9V1_9DINO|nr:unnamed protein product [Polarella glacialis]